VGSVVAAILLILGGGSAAPATDGFDQLDVSYIYLGVSCPEPNSIACDRIGVFISTHDKPDYLIATIAGRSVRLTDPGWHRDGAASFEGFLQAPGLLHQGPLAVDPTPGDSWLGWPQVTTQVRVTAVYGNTGFYEETLIPAVNLAAGYG
jgi:hypothetical protein